MAESGKPKYADEIWELIRLFSRLGKTVYGLLFVLVGWVLLIRTGREALSSKDVIDGLWLPVVDFALPLRLRWFQPSVSLIALLGAAALVAWWVLHSRLLAYCWAFVRHLLKPFIFVIAYVVPVIVGVLNLLLLPITVPIMWAVRRSRRRQFKARWLEKQRKEIPDEAQRQEAWVKHLSAMREAHGRDIVENVLTKGSWEPSYWIVIETYILIAARILRRLLSICRVGLAPITPQSYTEEMHAAKVPLQVFAQAMTRIRTELGELSLLDRIQFFELPPSARSHQVSQALRYAWLFDTDVLLWGSYKPTAERVISMNLSRRFAKPPKQDEMDEYGSDYQKRFFPYEVQADFPALSFDQEDEDEVYLVLLVAEILALQTAALRWDRGWRRMLSPIRIFDRSSFRGRDTIQEILLRVIPPALLRLGGDQLVQTRPITARHALVELAGQWVGSMLNVGVGRPFEDLSKRKGASSTLAQLRELAEACCRLQPWNAVAHYRLGALRILTGAKDEAIQSFRHAGNLERQSFQVHEIGARVAAETTDLTGYHSQDIALATWAAHAACAINTGSEHGIRDIRKMVDEELPEKLYYAVIGKPEPLAIAVIREMLPHSN